LTAGRNDDGAYLVLWALLVTAVFGVAALVLDIATLRQDRRTDRLASDIAATAAVSVLDPTDAGTYGAACQAAWDYVRVNLPADTDIASSPLCATTFPDTVSCTALLAARTAVGTVGDLRVEITHPVPAASTLMRAETPGGDRTQAATPSADGTSCERVAVRLVRRRTFSFGGVVGQPGGGTDVHSVGRAASVATPEVPGLVALHPSDCNTLTARANADVIVLGVPGRPGIVEVDSDATTACAAGEYVVKAAPGRVQAIGSASGPPVVRSFALSGPNPTRAYDPGDTASMRLMPVPTAAFARFGRGPVEYRYNCSAVVSCVGTPNIDLLEAQLQGPLGSAPVGYSTYTGPCSVTTDTVLAAGNWYVDCPTLELGARFALRSGNIVFGGDVRVLDNGCLGVNSSKCLPAGDPGGPVAVDNVMFVRGGILKLPGGDFALTRTFVWSAGTVDMSPDESGAKELTWTAPEAGVFEDLALWSEANGTHALGGHGSFLLEGIFYAPDGRLRLQGRTGGSVANAQMIGGKIDVTGDHDFTVAPLADRSLARTVRQVRLIR
jgi:hypothetical protein